VEDDEGFLKMVGVPLGALGCRQGSMVDIGTTTRCGDSVKPESDGLT